jgi:hypothetical protein
MGSDLHGKTILVLSDNDWLLRAIRVNLNAGLQARVLAPEDHAATNHADLIVVAMSRSSGEPLLALAQASLVHCVGQVPVLIISDRPFDPSPAEGISYLAFPFQVEDLRSTVTRLLEASLV